MSHLGQFPNKSLEFPKRMALVISWCIFRLNKQETLLITKFHSKDFKMKKILMAVLAFTSLTALSYDEVSAPIVQFEGTRIPMTYVCLNDNGDLQTTFAVQQYEESRRPHGDRDPVMVPTFKKFLTASVNYSRSVCIEESRGSRNSWCAKWGREEATYPLIYTAKYYKVRHTNNNTFRTLVKTAVVSVEDCK